MGAVSKLIDRIVAGEITAEEAAPELSRILVRDRWRPEPGSIEWMAAEWDVDDTDTWTEVQAAQIAGELTPEQVAVLSRAAFGYGTPDSTEADE